MAADRFAKSSWKQSGKRIWGATALRGYLGFGANSRIHTSKVLRLSEKLQVVIEIVEEEEKANAFLPELDKMIGGRIDHIGKSQSHSLSAQFQGLIDGPRDAKADQPCPALCASAGFCQSFRGYDL